MTAIIKSKYALKIKIKRMLQHTIPAFNTDVIIVSTELNIIRMTI
jgi:hypothetical protein